MKAHPRSILVVGAASQIGYHLLPRLGKAGWDVAATSRFPPPRDDRGASWHRLDLRVATALPQSGLRPTSLISLAPLGKLPPLVGVLSEVGTLRVIAFSSTSRFTKADSADPEERKLAGDFAREEDALAAQCERNGIHWTVFRPTLVYSPGLDRNVSEIARLHPPVGLLSDCRFGSWKAAAGTCGRPRHSMPCCTVREQSVRSRLQPIRWRDLDIPRDGGARFRGTWPCAAHRPRTTAPFQGCSEGSDTLYRAFGSSRRNSSRA